MQTDGNKVAAGSDDGTVIIWSYPGDGKQVFRRNGRSNFPLIIWNPFNRDVLASYNNAVSKRHIWRQKCAHLSSLAGLIKRKGKILMGIVQTKSRAHGKHSHELITKNKDYAQYAKIRNDCPFH